MVRPRRQPPVDVWTYFAQKEREYQEHSLVPDREIPQMFAEEVGSNGMRGRVFGNLFLSDTAYLSVSEVVEVEGDHVHREEYGYFLIIEGEEIWGYERDPTHDPPVHRHSNGHATRRAEPIAFKNVAGLAWAEVSERDSSELT